ncbi:hypothetical protein OHB04_16320 [Streptomyces sp. NBC_01775]|uniref:hypothetical protein n=1 Tax=Streptomyces sp. NBC_01775 TaxID=2975939 RepID=UPI002DD86EF4|nr:hypothetical protein [Streptomyces sp. NBC_01775]WSB77179.1 hypothetical protein OHB04_16320 [Streptomyces sp. NBC_01775]
MEQPAPRTSSPLASWARRFALPDDGDGDSPQEPAPVPVDWPAVETWLGLRLPRDYKALVDASGPLDLGEYLWVHAPCAQEGRFDYGEWLRDTHRETRVAAREATSSGPPSFHPAPGGLLAWAETRGGATLFWDTSAAAPKDTSAPGDAPAPEDGSPEGGTQEAGSPDRTPEGEKTGDPDAWPVVLFDDSHFPSPDPDAEPDTDPWYPLGLDTAGTLTALMTTGLPTRGGGRFGPLPPTARRTAYLTRAAPWTPPPTQDPAHTPARHAALTEGTGIPALTALVPPPPAPYLGTPDGRSPEDGWERLFDELGTRLPAEYLALMERYGAGCWSEWLRFFTPLREGENGFVWHVRTVTDAYRGSRERFPDMNPLDVWPEPGGFLPFANSIDADEIGWLTRGDPDHWPVIVRPRHARQGPPLEGSLTHILLEWLRGNLTTPGFAGLDEDDDPLDFIGFEPWPDHAYW